MKVYKKLQQARLKLQQAPLKKSGYNPYAKYNYFELGDFLPTIQTIFAEVGLCGTVSFGTEIASLTIVDVDAAETDNPKFISFSSPMSTAELKGCHAIQNLGAVQTYLRRYLWVTAMEIVENDALDAVTGSDVSKKAEPTVTSPPIVGKPGEWQIEASPKPEGDPVMWLNSIDQAVTMGLGMANKVDDLIMIFQKNKDLFALVKETDGIFYTELMEKFTQRREQLEGK